MITKKFRAIFPFIATYGLLGVILLFSGNSSAISIRGTFNQWGVQEMTQSATDRNLWTAEHVLFRNEDNPRFKFDFYNDWSYNFGDNNGDKYADQNGQDILVENNMVFNITFNSASMKYSIEAVSDEVNVRVFPYTSGFSESDILALEGSRVSVSKENSFGYGWDGISDLDVEIKSVRGQTGELVPYFEVSLEKGTYRFEVYTLLGGYRYKGEMFFTVEDVNALNTPQFEIVKERIEPNVVIYPRVRGKVATNSDELIGKTVDLYKNNQFLKTVKIKPRYVYHGVSEPSIELILKDVGDYVLDFKSEDDEAKYNGRYAFSITKEYEDVIDYRVDVNKVLRECGFSSLKIVVDSNSFDMECNEKAVWISFVKLKKGDKFTFDFKTFATEHSGSLGDSNSDKFAEHAGQAIPIDHDGVYAIRLDGKDNSYSMTKKALVKFYVYSDFLKDGGISSTLMPHADVHEGQYVPGNGDSIGNTGEGEPVSAFLEPGVYTFNVTGERVPSYSFFVKSVEDIVIEAEKENVVGIHIGNTAVHMDVRGVHLDMGEALFITGATDYLGNWKEAIRLNYNHYNDSWTYSGQLVEGLEFKIVKGKDLGGHTISTDSVSWMVGDNAVVPMNSGQSSVDIVVTPEF